MARPLRIEFAGAIYYAMTVLVELVDASDLGVNFRQARRQLFML